jgi:hypothetical protein
MREIKLSQNKIALVDDEDFEELNKHKWFFGEYAKRNIRNKDKKKQEQVRMHRVIMNAPKTKEVDHIDGDKLNNQKNNLRLCTKIENLRNKGKLKTNISGFKGVSYDKKLNKWKAQISVNNKKIYLGIFDDKLLAYDKYCIACKKYHGNFSRY